MVKEMAFVAYSVRDVAAATAFYRDVVGLKPSAMVSDHWAEFDVATATFGLGDGTPLGIEPGSCFSVTFEVDDVDAEQQRLKAAGVSIGDVHDTPVCRVAFATDPEGNRFGVHQRKNP